MNGAIITRFVGLRPKMYALEIDGGIVKKRAKGVQRAVLQKHIQFDDFIKTLHEEKCMVHTMHAIRSQSHTIATVQMQKISLSKLDNKRIILDDGIKTQSYVL